MLLLPGQTQAMVPLAQVEPLSQICLKEGRKGFAGSFQSRVLRDIAFPQLLSFCTLSWGMARLWGGHLGQMLGGAQSTCGTTGWCWRGKSTDGAHSPGREEMALSHTAQILAVINSYQLFVRHLGTVPPDTWHSVHLMWGFLPVLLL